MKHVVVPLFFLMIMVFTSGCIQQASIIGETNELPCSTVSECKSFIQSTGLQGPELEKAMEGIICENNRCYSR